MRKHKSNSYAHFNRWYSKRYNELLVRCDVWYAFGKKQLAEQLVKRGYDPETDEWQKDYIGFYGGGVIPRKNVELYKSETAKLHKCRRRFMSKRKNLTSAIEYELGNHEYSYTMDSTDALKALGLKDKYSLNKKQARCYEIARKRYVDWCYKNEIW